MRAALVLLSREAVRRNLSPVYAEALEDTARRFLGFVRKRPSRIGKEDVLRYLAERGRTLSAASHVFEATKLRAVLRVLAPDLVDVVSVKPASPLPQLVHGERDVQALLKEASRPRLAFPWARALALRDRALLELLYGAGLRAKETREARVLDLRLQEGLLLVRRAKRGEPAFLPLPKRSLEALGRYLEEGRPQLVKRDGRDQGVLLLTKRGTPLSRSLVDRTVRLIARRVGMRSTPHAFRRSIATQLLSRGVSVTAIQELLGHKKLETTARYLAVSREELRRAVERLEAMASPAADSRAPEGHSGDPRP